MFINKTNKIFTGLLLSTTMTFSMDSQKPITDVFGFFKAYLELSNDKERVDVADPKTPKKLADGKEYCLMSASSYKEDSEWHVAPSATFESGEKLQMLSMSYFMQSKAFDERIRPIWLSEFKEHGRESDEDNVDCVPMDNGIWRVTYTLAALRENQFIKKYQGFQREVEGGNEDIIFEIKETALKNVILRLEGQRKTFSRWNSEHINLIQKEIELQKSIYTITKSIKLGWPSVIFTFYLIPPSGSSQSSEEEKLSAQQKAAEQKRQQEQEARKKQQAEEYARRAKRREEERARQEQEAERARQEWEANRQAQAERARQEREAERIRQEWEAKRQAQAERARQEQEAREKQQAEEYARQEREASDKRRAEELKRKQEEASRQSRASVNNQGSFPFHSSFYASSSFGGSGSSNYAQPSYASSSPDNSRSAAQTEPVAPLKHGQIVTHDKKQFVGVKDAQGRITMLQRD